MTTAPAPAALAQSARRVFVDSLVRGSAAVPAVLIEALQQRLMSKMADAVRPAQLRDALSSLQQHGATWQMGLMADLRGKYRASAAANAGTPAASPAVAPAAQGASSMSLVGDATIEREIASSRLSLALVGDAHWQFTDLRTRMQALERRGDLLPDDLLRPQTTALAWIDAWEKAELTQTEWQILHETLEAEFALWLGAAYHDTNQWLLEQGVLPDVDLRPFIRRTRGLQASAQLGASFVESTSAAGALRAEHRHRGDAGGMPAAYEVVMVEAGQAVSTASGGLSGAAVGRESSRRSPVSVRSADVLQQMQQVLAREAPGLVMARPALAMAPASDAYLPSDAVPRSAPLDATGLVRISPRLQAVIQRAQVALQRPQAPGSGAPAESMGTVGMLEETRARSQAFKQVLKQAAGSPEERATIELVAMMFQSILQDERLPASIRVWFARLQMPVLRVAVLEPDFFATNDHPARSLIDRMGACALGFDPSQAMGDVLEREVKRIVQVVEAYPDTGRKVFQTVLTEFESFLSHFFAEDNDASKKGVSLAQQVEQRETLAIQYTIELRKMLADMPVDDGLREFLFQVWADVLAVTAMRHGAQAETTVRMKRAAADLIWSGGAKSSPEERAEVIRRFPALLKTLRDGMGHATIPAKKQDEHIRKLNAVLATAFTTKAAPIPKQRLDELFERLQDLESMLPNVADIDLDEDLVRDLSGHEREGLEVVSDGGQQPTDAMYQWARELPVGGWYRLNFRGREDTVQLAWVGAQHSLRLFVSPQGRAILFPLHRLAGFLQAGLLQPAQEETLTVKATRDALAMLEAQPGALQ